MLASSPQHFPSDIDIPNSLNRGKKISLLAKPEMTGYLGILTYIGLIIKDNV